MDAALKYVPVEALSSAPASAIKKIGWRGVMDEVRAQGRLLVTNHDKPEAVILPVGDYEAFMQMLQASEAEHEAALGALRERFDQRLAVLQKKSAGQRLRSVLEGPVRLKGKVKAGSRY